MAAERLTKGRLIQILIILFVLMGAFIWRTVTYDSPSFQCEQQKLCIIPFAQDELSMNYLAQTKQYTFNSKLKLQISFIAGQGTVKKEQHVFIITPTTEVATIRINDDKDNQVSVSLVQ